MKTVIFDLDGTLADTSGDLIAAANACFELLGHNAVLDAEADRLTAFHGGRAMLRLGFERISGNVDEADVDREYPLFLRHYERDIIVRTELYPGAQEAVEALLADGIKVGICTNKPEGLSHLLLRRLKVAELFETVVGADTLEVRKPDPEHYLETVRRAGGVPERSLLIGDTETDVATARAAGVPVVLVGFGPEGRGVERLRPDRILPDYGALGRIVSELID